MWGPTAAAAPRALQQPERIDERAPTEAISSRMRHERARTEDMSHRPRLPVDVHDCPEALRRSFVLGKHTPVGRPALRFGELG